MSDSGARSGLRAGIAIAAFCTGAAAIYVFSGDAYLWFKALHIIAVIAWMAGLLYLPRLFIYHHDKMPGSETSETFKTMESRLYRFIMNPAMMIAWLFGLFIAWQGQWFSSGWLHLKLVALVALTLAHVYFGRAVRAFGRDERPLTSGRWRLLNEVPAALMIVIVIMAVLKPF
ncbi:MAG: protoporphyrinogen oxidase HemJ [Rhizobium sp.]|nr:protoporphyrinogen oxidase HemJ [Rhizobium sp.]